MATNVPDRLFDLLCTTQLLPPDVVASQVLQYLMINMESRKYRTFLFSIFIATPWWFGVRTELSCQPLRVFHVADVYHGFTARL